MEAEDAYLAALKTVTGYSISAGHLTLFGGPGQVMGFERGTDLLIGALTTTKAALPGASQGCQGA